MTERERDVMLVRNSTGSLFRFPTHTLSSAFEIRAQGSMPSATTKVDPYLVAVFRISHVFFSFRLAFRYFSCNGQPTYNAHRTTLLGLALFRIGNLVLILRHERSEGSLALPTRPPTEIPKSCSSRYRLIPRWTFKTQRLRPLCRVVDGANLSCRRPSGVGRDDMDSHPADWGVNHPVCSSVLFFPF